MLLLRPANKLRNRNILISSFPTRLWGDNCWFLLASILEAPHDKFPHSDLKPLGQLWGAPRKPCPSKLINYDDYVKRLSHYMRNQNWFKLTFTWPINPNAVDVNSRQHEVDESTYLCQRYHRVCRSYSMKMNCRPSYHPGHGTIDSTSLSWIPHVEGSTTRRHRVTHTW